MAGNASKGYKIVLTADATLMSEYRGNMFFGFSSSAPTGFVPSWFYYKFVCPPVGSNGNGEALLAPYALRKIEAFLVRHFGRDQVIVAHPNHLEKAIGEDTRVVGLSTMDPLGIGPVTSTFMGLFGREAYDVASFRKLMDSIASYGRQFKVVAGGPGAWQLITEDGLEQYAIDSIVLGEAEDVIVPLFEKAIEGGPLPKTVESKFVENVDEEVRIVNPSICGLVEISRGCGRGCAFCSQTMRKLRCRSVRGIMEEVQTNISAGKTDVIFHSEDAFAYRGSGIHPNSDAVMDLFKSVSKMKGVERINVSHGSYASVLSEPGLLGKISGVLGLSATDWKGYQVGLETGSPRLLNRHMRGKCKPFQPEEWQDVVKRATAISNDAGWVPVATLVMGLPEENEEDVLKTLELIDDLSGMRTMFFPLFFVPIGALAGKDSFGTEKMMPLHFELFLRCWQVNLKQWPKAFDDVARNLSYGWTEKAALRQIFRLSVSLARRGLTSRMDALKSGREFRMGSKKYRFEAA